MTDENNIISFDEEARKRGRSVRSSRHIKSTPIKTPTELKIEQLLDKLKDVARRLNSHEVALKQIAMAYSSLSQKLAKLEEQFPSGLS